MRPIFMKKGIDRVIAAVKKKIAAFVTPYLFA